MKIVTHPRTGQALLAILFILHMTCMGNTKMMQDPRAKAEACLEKLTTAFWDWRLEESPEYGTKFGLHGLNDRLEQYTEQAMDTSVRDATALLLETRAVDVDLLSRRGRVTLAVLTDLLQAYIAGYEYREYGAYVPFNILNHPLLGWRRLIDWTMFDSEDDYQMALRRYRALPTQFDQFINITRKAIAAGTPGPLVGVVELLEFFDNWLDDPLNSFFITPFQNISNTVLNSTRRFDLRSEASDIISNTIQPAVRRFRDFIEQEYMPNVRQTPGVTSLPGGDAYYRACLEWHLSLNITPKAIHDLGLREVHRIYQNMENIKQESGYQGDLKSFIEHLKNDSSNFYQTEEEMLDAFRRHIRRISSKLNLVIHDPPFYPLVIRESDSPYSPTGRYTEPPLDGSRAAIFMANVLDPWTRPRFNMMALTLHEAVPGHHTQMSYALRDTLPAFQRAIEYRKYYAVPFNWRFYTAYVEGWALYAESLGEELGLYDEPYSLLGRYSSEMLRACRLVVDTGIHAFGWSQQRAVEYLANYTTLPRSQIENEVKRYITIPGQAVSYKIGELKIKELRKRAEERLGADFDVRQFHRCILELGPTPLSLVEDRVNDWILDTVTANSVGHLTSSTLSLYRLDGPTPFLFLLTVFSVFLHLLTR